MASEEWAYQYKIEGDDRWIQNSGWGSEQETRTLANAVFDRYQVTAVRLLKRTTEVVGHRKRSPDVAKLDLHEAGISATISW